MNSNQIVYIDERASKILTSFDRKVQTEFYLLFDILKKHGKLEYPDSKKITKNLFEIRIQIQNQFRCFYAYISQNRIMILHIFIKKTQKTPKKEISTALKRLKQYE